jgi:nicotinate-nucleotide adenylyltransferase
VWVGEPQYTRHVTKSVSRRLGLLGGTFDPPHRGHMAAAETALAQVGLDRVDFVVANDPWQKSEVGDITPAAIRLEMTRALIGGHVSFGVDDREIRRGGPTYTVDTLTEIAAVEPDTSVFVIVGADAASRLHTWHRHHEVLALSTLIVVNRAGTPLFDPATYPGASIVNIMMEPVLVSSTDIRAAVRAGGDVSEETSPEVNSIIRSHGLYQGAA